MKDSPLRRQAELQGLPDITFRQLEVFRVVLVERSYANAALELRSTRANIKRVCEDFEKAVGRPLFAEDTEKNLVPSAFAHGMVEQLGPLSRSLRRMGEGVRLLHAVGRVVRFAAAEEFFRGGLFTDFLGRLQIKESFMPCFLRVEAKRFRIALLNTECDIYFGIGLTDCDRLDLVDLGPVPWKINTASGVALPRDLSDLPAGRWGIMRFAENDEAEDILRAFHDSGAAGGRVLENGEEGRVLENGFILSADTGTLSAAGDRLLWPCYRFFAALRKYHPYSELKSKLSEASLS